MVDQSFFKYNIMEKQLTPEQIQEQIKKQDHAHRCSAEVKVILDKYGLSFKPMLITTPEGIIPNIVLVEVDVPIIDLEVKEGEVI